MLWALQKKRAWITWLHSQKTRLTLAGKKCFEGWIFIYLVQFHFFGKTKKWIHMEIISGKHWNIKWGKSFFFFSLICSNLPKVKVSLIFCKCLVSNSYTITWSFLTSRFIYSHRVNGLIIWCFNI